MTKQEKRQALLEIKARNTARNNLYEFLKLKWERKYFNDSSPNIFHSNPHAGGWTARGKR